MRKRYTQKQIKNLEKFKSAKFNYSKFVKKYYMEKGDAYISAKVSSIDDVLSKYSIDGYEWINPEFAAYIEESAYYIPEENGIIIEICGAKFTDEEKETIENVINNYFGLSLQDKELDIEINNRKSNYLLIFGVISVIILIAIQNHHIGTVLSELLLLAIWFFIWEYGDYRLLKNMDLNLEKLYAGQLASAKIQFVENAEESESKKNKNLAKESK